MFNLSDQQTNQLNFDMNELASLIRHLNTKGHNLATSGNYSLRNKFMQDYVLISESGIDKANFEASNFLPVHLQTKEVLKQSPYLGRKSSDETAIHLAIYQNTNAGCVLHSHFKESLLFARLHPSVESITLTDLEMIKAFKGINSHEEELTFPVFNNTQDMDSLAKAITTSLSSYKNTYAVMLRDHGIYVWGDTVKDAKRHLEAFEYIFKFYVELRKL